MSARAHPRRVARVGGLLLMGLLLSAQAADCNAPAGRPMPDAGTPPLRKGHHPVDRSLPRSDAFKIPAGCGDGFWFYDQNSNARADPPEPRLFGGERVLACASCHADGAAPTATSASAVFLRQEPATLCLVCHNL